MIVSVPRRNRVIMVTATPSHHEVANITRKRRAEYANRCNADLVEILDDAVPAYPMANKWRQHRIAQLYSEAMFVDGDVIFGADAPNLFEVAPGKIVFRDELPIAGYDVTYKSELKEVARRVGVGYPPFCPNAGIMIFPSKYYHLYQEPIADIPTYWCFEQYYLACRIVKAGLQSDVAFLNQRQHLMYIEPDFWQQLPGYDIVHINGSPNGNGYRSELASRILAGNFGFFPPPDDGSWRPAWRIA